MKTRSPWTRESPFMLLVGLELGDRVEDAWRRHEIFIGWAVRVDAHNGSPVLALMAANDWRWWWHERPYDTQARKGKR